MGVDLRLGAESLSPGNVTTRDLRADLRNVTPEERLAQAMELREFLTDVAATAAEERQPAP